MSLYWDMDGNRMTGEAFAQAFNDNEGKRIGNTTVGDADVSTVWLGVDHQFGDGPPLIFETMIFGGPHDQFCERYSTKKQAADGHKRIVLALQEGRDPEEAR